MGTKRLADVIRASAENVRLSFELTKRISGSITHSDIMISRSRRLLSDLQVSGSPRFRYREPANAGLPEANQNPEPSVRRDPAESGPDLVRVVERNFTGETVCLDGKHFIDCVVEDCLLEYSGGPVVMEGTNFAGCRFHFGGEAAMTVAMLECFGLLARSGDAHAAPPPSPSVRSARVN